MKIILLTSFLLVLSQSAIAVDTIFSATYKGRHTGIGIELVRKLEQHSETEFRVQSKADSFVGSITEQSRFTNKGGLLVPSSYHYTRKVLGSKSKQKLIFDWDKMQASYRREDKPKKNADYDLVEGALDPSLYQLKLQQELFKGRELFNFSFAKNGRLKKMEFKLLPERTKYQLGNRELEAVEVERINHGDQKQTKILLLPALNYQIAKITHTEEDGSQYKIALIDFKADFKRLSAFYHSINVPTELGQLAETPK